MNKTLGETKIDEIMSRKPMTIKPEDSLTTAWEIMHQNDIRHLPVVNGTKLCGILSDRDILCELNFQGSVGRLNNNTVDYAMNPQVISVRAGTDVKEVIRLMLRHKIHSLVVVNKDQEPIGIVTDFDLLLEIE